jgi:hypothetical protein
LDSSTHEEGAPEWVKESRLITEKDSKIFIRTGQTVRGDERVNGCFDLAKLDAKEILLSEIATDVRGSLDNAQQSINENAEIIIGKVRTGEFEGRVTGLRHAEEFFERYLVGGSERIDCYVLSEITESDFQKMKQTLVSRLEKVDQSLREAITKKQVDFFNQKQATDEKTKPSSEL